MHDSKLSSGMRTLAIIFAICVIPIASAFGADQICNENFENVIPGPIPEMNPTGSGEISRAARAFYGNPISDGAFLASGGNPNQCAMANVRPYTNDAAYDEPKWRFDNNLGGGREFYVKFDCRVDSDLGTSNGTREIYNFKFIKLTDHTHAGSAPVWSPALNFEPSDGSYSWYNWSQTSANQEYYMNRATTKLDNHMMDNQWHTFEVYVHIGSGVCNEGRNDPDADGIVRVWEDGVLIIEDTTVPMRGSSSEGQEVNSIAFIRHAKAQGAPVGPFEGHIYFDNIEVWDGMPDGGDTTPPDPPENVEVEVVPDPPPSV